MSTRVNNKARFFAVCLMVGGVIGVVISVLMILQLLQQNILLIAFFLFFVFLFAWVAFVGFRLWQGTVYGYKWAPIVFASQIPVISSTGFQYAWFTGIKFDLVMQFAPVSKFNFLANLGANIELYFGGSNTDISAFGINVFALIAFLMLLGLKRS